MKKYTYDIWVTYQRKCEVLANSRNEAEERIGNMWKDHIADSVPERIGDGTFDLEYDDHEINYDCETEIKEEERDTDVKEVNVLSPENVFGMITAINESYRKLYTGGK